MKRVHLDLPELGFIVGTSCSPRSRDRYIFLCVHFHTDPRSLFVAFVGFCVMFSVCVSALGIPMKELL